MKRFIVFFTLSVFLVSTSHAQKRTALVRVPNVIGMKAPAAASVIKNAGLPVGSISISGKGIKGTVGKLFIRNKQIKPYQPVNKGTRIVLGILNETHLYVTTPDFTGKTLEKAEILLTQKGLRLGKVLEKPVTEAGQALILYQNIPAGSSVEKKTTVSFLISKPLLVTVPSIIGMTKEEAQKALKQKDLKLGTITHRKKPRLDAGRIFEQKPEAKTLAEKGTEIMVSIAKEEKIRVPNLIGRTGKGAIQLLKRLELIPGTITGKRVNAIPNTIIDQDPPSRSYVPKGTSVSFVIAKGSGINLTPVTGMSQDKAIKFLNKQGLNAEIKIVPDLHQPEGTVVKVIAPKKLVKGSFITLIVAKPPAQRVPLPSLIGKKGNAAQKYLSSLDLNVTTKQVPCKVPSGYVIGTVLNGELLSGDTTVPAGSSIELLISLKTEPTPAPEPVKEPEAPSPVPKSAVNKITKPDPVIVLFEAEPLQIENDYFSTILHVTVSDLGNADTVILKDYDNTIILEAPYENSQCMRTVAVAIPPEKYNPTYSLEIIRKGKKKLKASKSITLPLSPFSASIETGPVSAAPDGSFTAILEVSIENLGSQGQYSITGPDNRNLLNAQTKDIKDFSYIKESLSAKLLSDPTSFVLKVSNPPYDPYQNIVSVSWPPVIIELKADHEKVILGQEIAINWDAKHIGTGSMYFMEKPGVERWEEMPAKGSLILPIEKPSTSGHLFCFKAVRGSEEYTDQLKVIDIAPTPEIVDFAVTPTHLRKATRNPVTLSFTVKNAYSVLLSNVEDGTIIDLGLDSGIIDHYNYVNTYTKSVTDVPGVPSGIQGYPYEYTYRLTVYNYEYESVSRDIYVLVE